MNADVLIVGGGLAGSAAAITLARNARRVLLLERDAAPQHKVCGEFLSGEALRYLHALDVDLHALGAVPIEAVRLVRGKRMHESGLPFPAFSLTRKALDEALLKRADSAGVCVRRGIHVAALTSDGNGWHASTRAPAGESKQVFSAGTAVLATGKHDLHAHTRPRGVQNDLIAFKMYWSLAPSQAAALRGHVELALFPGGYAGLQPVEDGAANLCCVVKASVYKRMAGSWPRLLDLMRAASPHLAARLVHAEPLLQKPLALSSIPYGLVQRTEDTLWRVGDQAVVIPSFTGDGMSLALHTGVLAARMLLSGASAAEYARTCASQVARQVHLATYVSRGLVNWSWFLFHAAGLFPGSLRTLARQTRLPERYLLA